MPWLGLKTVESIGLPLGFRSDSLVSLINQNAAPDFSATDRVGLRRRPFAWLMIVLTKSDRKKGKRGPDALRRQSLKVPDAGINGSPVSGSEVEVLVRWMRLRIFAGIPA